MIIKKKVEIFYVSKSETKIVETYYLFSVIPIYRLITIESEYSGS